MNRVLDLLPSVEVDDLPALLKYLITNCNSTNEAHVGDSIRNALHFVNPTDPRLAGKTLFGKRWGEDAVQGRSASNIIGDMTK